MGEWHYVTATTTGPDAEAAGISLQESFREISWPGSTDEEWKGLREHWGPQDSTIWAQEKHSAADIVDATLRVSRLFPATTFRLDITAPMGYEVSMVPGLAFYEGWDFDAQYIADLKIVNGTIKQNPGSPISGRRFQSWEKPPVRRFVRDSDPRMVKVAQYLDDSERDLAADFDYLEKVGLIRKTDTFTMFGIVQPIYEATGDVEVSDDVKRELDLVTAELAKTKTLQDQADRNWYVDVDNSGASHAMPEKEAGHDIR
jgi:hypothetical protein